jgi:hypothetical protein
MSNPSPTLFPAVVASLAADAGVIAAFGDNPVAIYRVPPSDAPCPYLGLPGAHVLDMIAEGFDGADACLQVDVWSRPDPTDYAEAEAIAAAVSAWAARAVLVVPGFAVIRILPIDTRVLMERDGQTVHGVVSLEISADPA